jgi:hypothetical protein
VIPGIPALLLSSCCCIMHESERIIVVIVVVVDRRERLKREERMRQESGLCLSGGCCSGWDTLTKRPHTGPTHWVTPGTGPPGNGRRTPGNPLIGRTSDERYTGENSGIGQRVRESEEK